MKVWLLVAAGLFFLLSFFLLIVTIAIFLVIRKRKRKAVAVDPSRRTGEMPAPAAIQQIAVETDNDRTVLVPIPVRPMKLLGVSGLLGGQTFEFGANGVYIGRDRASAQIVVDDPRVSKRHVWIGFRDGVVTAIDQNSTNGTYLNDPDSARIGEVILNPGDTIIVSDDVVRLQLQK